MSVTVQLWQHVKASDTNIEYGSPVTLSAENDWQYTWTDLPKETPEGEEYFYTVEEINVPEGFRVYYSPSNYMQISAGEIAVFNQRTFILPDTGGRGTLCYILAGSLLTAAGTGCIILRRRKYKKA